MFGNRNIPTIYLAGIGVVEPEARQGIGAALMLDAFEKAAAIADLAGTACMTLDAVDEKRAQWYEKLQFKRFDLTADKKIRMFIPLATILDALHG